MSTPATRRSGQFYFRIGMLLFCLALVWGSWLRDITPLYGLIGATASALGLLLGDES